MRQWTIDAFADAAFLGNPACVVEPFDAWPEDAWMQRLAQENNQAETAFLRRRGGGEYDLRWFTPAIEVPLCGHATLASAHALATELADASPRYVFHTQSGPLVVERAGDGYSMDFPANPPRLVETPEGLAQAMGGVRPLEVWAAAYLLAVVEDEAAVRAVTPDLAQVKKLSTAASGGRGDLIVTARAQGKPYDVVSRFFAPGAGIAEDPTTGSAHCILAPFWSDRLGRAKLNYFQAYPTRGGKITAEVRGDRVVLGGKAVTTVESVLRV